MHNVRKFLIEKSQTVDSLPRPAYLAVHHVDEHDIVCLETNAMALLLKRICPDCGSEARVTETRLQPEGHVMRRYRCEENPEHRFVTHELMREDVPSDEETERLSTALADALALIQKRKTHTPIAA